MKCEYCDQEMGDGVSCTQLVYVIDDVEFDRMPNDSGRKCGDCRTPPGGLHHPGCDMERCPKCNSQAISCGC